MIKKTKKKVSQTSARLITRTFWRIFMIFTMLTTLLVSSVVAFTSLQIRESEGSALLASVQEAAINGNVNWKEFRLIGEKGERESFVRIQKSSGFTDESQGTTEFLQNRVRWGYFSLSGDDIFWQTTSAKNGTKAELWLNINIVVQSMMRAILLIVLLMLLLFVLALFWIRKAAATISRPLADLTLATEQKEVKQLPVAQNPLEVQQLSQSFNGLLERLNQKIIKEQQFVSDASHELRTPLAAIRGHVTLLKRRWHEHPEIVDDSLAYIDEESLRMKGLIENLLTISRGNHPSVKKEIFDLGEFTDRIISQIQPALTQKIRNQMTDKCFVKTDKMALQHIFVVFLENAGKYSPAESKITVQLNQQENNIEISVADEGMGISDAEKENIFERFYRIDKSRSSEIPGSGLGLAIAKQYAQLIDAELWVTDHLPQGAIFHLKLERFTE